MPPRIDKHWLCAHCVRGAGSAAVGDLEEEGAVSVTSGEGHPYDGTERRARWLGDAEFAGRAGAEVRPSGPGGNGRGGSGEQGESQRTGQRKPECRFLDTEESGEDGLPWFPDLGVWGKKGRPGRS